MSNNIINEKSLTVREINRLEKLESVVKENFLAFVKVGKALAEIRENRLYRNQENRTWEGYCRELWDMSCQHAGRIIACGEVIENLKSEPMGSFSPDHPQFILPINERQTRPLAKLEAKEQAIVWGTILEHRLTQFKKGQFPKISETTVKKAVLEHHGKNLEVNIDQSTKEATQNRKDFASDEFTAAYTVFGEQIKAEHASNWRNTSRSVVFQNLSNLLDLVALAGPKEIKQKACSMELSNREKLEKASFRVFRMRPAELVIEESIGGEWRVITSHDTPSQLSDAFKELMEDPQNLKA